MMTHGIVKPAGRSSGSSIMDLGTFFFLNNMATSLYGVCKVEVSVLLVSVGVTNVSVPFKL